MASARPGDGASGGIAVFGAGTFTEPCPHLGFDLRAVGLRMLSPEPCAHEVLADLEHVEGQAETLTGGETVVVRSALVHTFIVRGAGPGDRWNSPP